MPELAKEINVEYLVEASVMGTKDSVTLQLRLIEVFPQEAFIWAQSCSSDFTNILKLHSDLAEQIAENIHLEMSEEEIEKIPLSRAVNPESYKAYLREMYFLNQLTSESVEKGLEQFHKALELNPYLALMHYLYSWALYLWDRMDEAIIEHKLAQKFDPFKPLHIAWLGALYTFDGQGGRSH